jgi:hypothetical protein
MKKQVLGFKIILVFFFGSFQSHEIFFTLKVPKTGPEARPAFCLMGNSSYTPGCKAAGE